MTASDRGTVTGSARNSGTVTATRTVTWTPSGSYNSSGVKSDSMNDSDYATQVANSMESRVYDAPTFSLASSYTFGEDGGSYTISPTGGKQTYTDTYTSGSHSTGSTTLSGTYTYAVQASAAGFSLSGNKVTATKNTATTEREGFVVRATLTANGKSSYKDMTFSQEAASLSDISWTVQLTYADVSASGGTVHPQLSYTLSYLLGGEKITIQSGATITYEGASNANGDVTADDLGTTIQNRALVATVTVKLSYTIDGELTTTSKTVSVYQAGNYVTRIDLTGFAIAYSKSVSAAGGTVSPTVTNGTVRFYYSSGSNGTATPSGTYGSLTSAIRYSGSAANGFTAPNATTGAMTASDRGTVTGSSRNSGTVTATRTVTWTPSGSYNSSGVKSDSMSDSDYATQVANSVISSSRVYDAPTFSLASSYTFGEDGGSYTISPTGGKQTYTDTYTSGSHSTGSTTLSGTYSYTTQTAAAGFSRSNNIVSATKNTATTERGGFVVRVTLTANGKSSYKDITFSQEAASLNVEGWSISLTYSDIPAGGGSVSPNLTYTFTYVSAGTAHHVTTGAVVSYDYNNGIVSASTLGTTEKSRTLIRTIKVTLSYALNGQVYTGSTTANVYQEANIATKGYLVNIWGTRGYEDEQTAFSYNFVNGNTSYDGDALGFSPFIWNDYKYASDIPIYLTLQEYSSYSSGKIGNYVSLTPSLIKTENVNGSGSLLNDNILEITFTPNLFPKNIEGNLVISGNNTKEFSIKITQVRTSYYLFVDGTYTPFDENCECTVSNGFKSDEANYTFKICGDPEGSIIYPDGDPVFVSDSQFEIDEQPSWITDTKDDNETIIVTFEENITGSIRNGQLVFGYQQESHGLNPYDREGRRFNFYVNVTQATQQGVLEISPSTNTITGTGTIQFTVQSSSNWTAKLEPAILGGKSPYAYATINPSSGSAGEQLIAVNIFDNYDDISADKRIFLVRCENQEGRHVIAQITQSGILPRQYNLCINRDGYYLCLTGFATSTNPTFEISKAFKPEGDSFKFEINNIDNSTLLESSEEPTMELSPSNAGNISYSNGEFSVEIKEGNVSSRALTAKVTYNDEIHSYFNGPYKINFTQEAYGLNYVYMETGNTHFQLFITNETSGLFNSAQVQIGLLLQTTQGQTYEPTLTFAPNSTEMFFDPVGYYGVNIPKNIELVILALHVKVSYFNITSVSNPSVGLQIDSALINRTTTTGERLARFTANYPEYTNRVIAGVCEFDCYNIDEGPQFALTDGDSTILSNTGTIRLHIMY